LALPVSSTLLPCSFASLVVSVLTSACTLSTTAFHADAVSQVLNLKARSSFFTSPSLKSAAVQVQARSELPCGLISSSFKTTWLQQTFKTCSLLIRNLALPVVGFLRILKSPLPLSFHSLVSCTNLKRTALSEKSTSSPSSPVFTSISSGRGMTGANSPVGSYSSSAPPSSAPPSSFFAPKTELPAPAKPWKLGSALKAPPDAATESKPCAGLEPNIRGSVAAAKVLETISALAPPVNADVRAEDPVAGEPEPNEKPEKGLGLAVSSFFSSTSTCFGFTMTGACLKVKPPIEVVEVELGVALLETLPNPDVLTELLEPKVNPEAAVLAVGADVEAGVPKLKPEAWVVAAAPPNLKPPPAPMVITAGAGAASAFNLATSSSLPGLAPSQAKHWILSSGLLVRQAPHSHLPAF